MDTVSSALNDGVLLGMDATNTVTVSHEATNVYAMGELARAAVVACCQYAIVERQHAAHGRPRTRRTLRNRVRYRHKVLVPSRTHYNPHAFNELSKRPVSRTRRSISAAIRCISACAWSLLRNF